MLGNKYIAAVIGVLLLVIVAYNLKFFMSRRVQPQTSPAKISEPVRHAERKSDEHKSGMNPVRMLEKEDKGKWKRDPFDLKGDYKVAQEKTEYDLKGIHLMGIIKRDNGSYALINGKVYSVNDRIGDAVVREIKKHGVVLSINGKIHEISFEDYTVVKEKSK